MEEKHGESKFFQNLFQVLVFSHFFADTVTYAMFPSYVQPKLYFLIWAMRYYKNLHKNRENTIPKAEFYNNRNTKALAK